MRASGTLTGLDVHLADRRLRPGPSSRLGGRIRKYADAGYTHIRLHQIGPDQEGFFKFYEQEVLPANSIAHPNSLCISGRYATDFAQRVEGFLGS